MEGIHLSKASQDLRYNSSIIFTYIFIVEMALKLVGMGISGIFFHPHHLIFLGYTRDIMNLLDGFVCTVSIFEIFLDIGS